MRRHRFTSFNQFQTSLQTGASNQFASFNSLRVETGYWPAADPTQPKSADKLVRWTQGRSQVPPLIGRRAAGPLGPESVGAPSLSAQPLAPRTAPPSTDPEVSPRGYSLLSHATRSGDAWPTHRAKARIRRRKAHR